mmetsp:Transcript_12203/g.18433  ORF Transcript_12203/g.18433 Transcript_12203/m.18433 type:complete len:227 (+) Transcript_12203:36-716(+)|eukprot:CAMPEP_0185020948 /NCGR_PEP_ID=MMETSP1103-20130426/3606_1 /TAXON_ID=36769 /ORGANISM="Paraphysomonas bandaiensis, Strain Caron Lab Isolate" /LENGTH=226 /DNA_ID=CAMNT_0027552177 /DNA_START=34 /DNA_END=714 /DNA_ORIENTATION=-
MSRFNSIVYTVLCATLMSHVAADSDEIVTCGSTIKLIHAETKHHLHSHGIAYGSGSGQQSVTCHGSTDDQGSMWILKEASTAPAVCEAGKEIKCGDHIRLQHLSTGKNLHSHLFKSPLTNNQEVSGFGENGEGDTGDNWEVICKPGSQWWIRGETVQFKHVDTGKYLYSSESGKFSVRNCGQNCPIMGQLEVCAFSRQGDPKTRWKTGQGIYFPKLIPEDSLDDEL